MLSEPLRWPRALVALRCDSDVFKPSECWRSSTDARGHRSGSLSIFGWAPSMSSTPIIHPSPSVKTTQANHWTRVASCPQTALRAGRIPWLRKTIRLAEQTRTSQNGGTRSGWRATVKSSPVRSLTVAVLIGVSTT